MRSRTTLGIAALVVTGSVWTLAQPSATPVQLTLRKGTSMAAALSPDGRTIAIDLLGAIWTLDVDGGAARAILDDGYDAHAPAWSPDGTGVAFQAYHRDTWHVWTMKADGTGLRQVTSGPYDDREPHWSPDGRTLAFSLRSQRQLRRVDRGAGHRRQITRRDDARGQRLDAGVVARRPRDRVRLGSRGPRHLRPPRRAGGAERQLAADTATLFMPCVDARRHGRGLRRRSRAR